MQEGNGRRKRVQIRTRAGGESIATASAVDCHHVRWLDRDGLAWLGVLGNRRVVGTGVITPSKLALRLFLSGEFTLSLPCRDLGLP